MFSKEVVTVQLDFCKRIERIKRILKELLCHESFSG
jgi:hypothetical protein